MCKVDARIGRFAQNATGRTTAPSDTYRPVTATAATCAGANDTPARTAEQPGCQVRAASSGQVVGKQADEAGARTQARACSGCAARCSARANGQTWRAAGQSTNTASTIADTFRARTLAITSDDRAAGCFKTLESFAGATQCHCRAHGVISATGPRGPAPGRFTAHYEQPHIPFTVERNGEPGIDIRSVSDESS